MYSFFKHGAKLAIMNVPKYISYLLTSTGKKALDRQFTLWRTATAARPAPIGDAESAELVTCEDVSVSEMSG